MHSLLRSTVALCLAVVAVHGTAQPIAFSSDGLKLCEAQNDTVLVFDVAKGTVLKTLAHADVQCVAYSPNGKAIASGSYDGTVRIWDATTGKSTREITVPGDGITDANVTALAFSPDGQTLATASLGSVFLWDVAAGRRFLKLDGHALQVSSTSFSPDGKRLVSAGADGVAVVWDVETGRAMFNVQGQRMWCAKFSPDSKQLLVAADDGARLHDAKTGELVASLPSEEVVSAVFSPDGKSIVIASRNGSSSLWEVSTSKQTGALSKASKDQFTNYAEFAPKGGLVATFDGARVTLWSASTRKQVRKLGPSR